MNDDLNQNQANATKSFNEMPVNICQKCKQNPCVCPRNGVDIREKIWGKKIEGKDNRTKPTKIKFI